MEIFLLELQISVEKSVGGEQGSGNICTYFD